MNTRTDDRLAAALAARAEQVREDDLHPPVLPPGQQHHRALTVLAAAAAVLVLVGAGLLTRHLVHGDAPVTPTQQPPDTPHRVTGDVDGDGSPDRVTLHGRDLTVLLGSGRRVHKRLYPGERTATLAGLADVGGRGHAIVLVEPTNLGTPLLGRDPTEAVVLRLADGRLVRTAFRPNGQGTLTRDRFDTFWIAADRLHRGFVLPATGPTRTVWAWTYALDGRELAPSTVTRLCWQPTTEPHPTVCGAGHDATAPSGRLPGLLPAAGTLVGPGRSFTDIVAGRRVTVRYLSRSGDPTAAEARVRFSVTVDGRTHTLTTPRSVPALISDQLVTGGNGEFAIVFRNETGDGELEDAYVFDGGGLHPARIPDSAPFGDTFVNDGRAVTWQTADGGLYSGLVVTPASAHASQTLLVWSWQPRGRRLVPTVLGSVCMAPEAWLVDPGSPDGYRRCGP